MTVKGDLGPSLYRPKPLINVESGELYQDRGQTNR